MNCGHSTSNQKRTKNVFKEQLYDQYSLRKQSYLDLSKEHHKSVKTIQKYLDDFNEKKVTIAPVAEHNKIIIGMDSFYFGRGFGVMLFRDLILRKNVYWCFIKYETVALYCDGINLLKNLGWDVKGIVCDGKKGLLKAYKDIPTQMCQFHQQQIITRYLTTNPKLPAAIELKEIVDMLTETDKESFIGMFENWKAKWSDFLKQKTINNETKKWHYSHKKLRSAVHSIKLNLQYLFTFYDYPELNIPNTNNSVEGTISDVKKKVKIHQGLKLHRKIKLLNKLLGK